MFIWICFIEILNQICWANLGEKSSDATMGKLSIGNHAVLIFHGFWNHSRYNCFKFHLLFEKNRYNRQGQLETAQKRNKNTKLEGRWFCWEFPDFFSHNHGSGKDGDKLTGNYAIAGESHFSLPSLWEYLEKDHLLEQLVGEKHSSFCLATLRSPAKN